MYELESALLWLQQHAQQRVGHAPPCRRFDGPPPRYGRGPPPREYGRRYGRPHDDEPDYGHDLPPRWEEELQAGGGRWCGVPLIC